MKKIVPAAVSTGNSDIVEDNSGLGIADNEFAIDKHGIKVFEDDAIVRGKTISDWTKDWWRWALQAPAIDNPVFSASPTATHFDNNGKIFFLAGRFQDGPIVQDGTITGPVSTPVLFPMINIFDSEGPGIPESIPDFVASGRGTYADEAKLVTDLFQNSITDAHAKIMKDGKTLLDLHSPDSSEFGDKSETFAIGAPRPGSEIESLLSQLGALPLDPTITNLPFTSSSGDWLMLGKLEPGTYALEFGGKSSAITDPKTGTSILGPVTIETTDTLIVGHV